MPKAVLVVLLVAAVAATGVLLLWQTEAGGFFGRSEREEVVDEQGNELTAPRLQGVPGAPRGRGTEGVPTPEPHASTDQDIVLTVQVVDDETGAPIAGAVLTLETSQPECPRLGALGARGPAVLRRGSGNAPAREDPSVRQFATDREGRFEFLRLHVPPGDVFEVFAEGGLGYVLGVACKVRVPGQATVRLKRGIALSGRVTTAQNKAVFDADVVAMPGTGTPSLPGHAGWSPTDEQGRFAIEGLLPGALRVTIQGAGFWPLVVEPEDPADDRERTYVLQPAYTFKFRLRTNDGREVVNPTLQANAPLARPPFQHVGILRLLDDRNADGQLTEGVMVPASVGTVALELKAEGYAAWRAPAYVVPPEGGEITLPVVLERDSGQGGLRFTFEDERAQRLKYRELRALPPSIMAMERQDLAGGIVYEVQDDLRFPSLPPGKYRFGLRAFAYAPEIVETAVIGGTETEHRVAFRPAARLRVRFTAPTARTVRFQLTQNGRPVPALPETEAPKGPSDAAAEDPTLSAGAEGALLGGLASGTYVVEVLSEDLRPSRTSVTVREGETEEVEIRVEPK